MMMIMKRVQRIWSDERWSSAICVCVCVGVYIPFPRYSALRLCLSDYHNMHTHIGLCAHDSFAPCIYNIWTPSRGDHGHFILYYAPQCIIFAGVLDAMDAMNHNTNRSARLYSRCADSDDASKCVATRAAIYVYSKPRPTLGVPWFCALPKARSWP